MNGISLKTIKSNCLEKKIRLYHVIMKIAEDNNLYTKYEMIGCVKSFL